MVAAALVLTTESAAACSCGPAPAPTVDFTGIAVEDLGYSDDDSGLGSGETRAWLIDVTDARLGVAAAQVRISIVAEPQDADGTSSGGECGLDANLILGESYDVTSGGLESMSLCGSVIDGPRADGPVRGDDDDEPRLLDLLVIFAAGAVVLMLAGLLVVRTGRRS